MSILPAITQMKPGDHYCGVFRSDEEHRAVIVDFVRDGVARNEKIIYIVNVHSVDQVRSMLGSAGIEIDALIDKGQVVLLTAREAYLRDGEFVPDKMLTLLVDETDKAVSEGYAGLRGTGEMTWALAGEPGSERLVEYEALINERLKGKKFLALCQYDRRRFDAEMLLDVVQVHPDVLYGRESCDNTKMYYVSPELFLERDRQSATLDTWLSNLSSRNANG
jgi:hypothetical protein